MYHRVLRDQEAFLRRFHGDHPGVTAAALARGRVVGTDGSSYDRVARAIPIGGRVLDLGCGDGTLLARLVAHGHCAAELVGVDVSEHELRAARVRDPDIAYVHARAQAVPLAAATCAAVASHLAFTLMPDLDAIVAELARVLVPGGRFVALVGGGPRGDDAFAGLLELAEPYARAAPPTPRLGERRARTDAGLAALFAAFASLAIDDLTIDLSGTAAEVWDSLAPSYELATVAPAARADLRAAFLAAAPQWRRPDGAISATMYARLVTAIR